MKTILFDFDGTLVDSMHQISLFEGMKEMLQDLHKKGYRIAFLSSNSEENIRSFLQNNNICFIDDVICSSRILGKDKMIQKFAKRQKVSPDNMLYVGDEERDIFACQKAGVPVVWVSWGYEGENRPMNAGPTHRANEPLELLHQIERHFLECT